MAIAPVEIEIDGLCKRFGAAPVTDYVLGAAIRHHAFVALLGRSGCGKSTLLNLVAGLLEPSAGEVRVKGRRVAGPGEGKGMVFQQHAPFPWLLVLTRWQSIAAISGFAGSTVRRARRHRSAGLLRRHGAGLRGVRGGAAPIVDRPRDRLRAQRRAVMPYTMHCAVERLQRSLRAPRRCATPTASRTSPARCRALPFAPRPRRRHSPSSSAGTPKPSLPTPFFGRCRARRGKSTWRRGGRADPARRPRTER